MKKMFALILAVAMLLSATVALAETMPFGMLSMLNMTEDQCLNYVYLRTLATGVLMMEGLADSELIYEEEGTEDVEMDEDVEYYEPEGDEEWEEGEEDTPSVVFYDSLDAMLMALNSGDIIVMDVYQSVAKYLCAQNDNLAMGWEFDPVNNDNEFANRMFSTYLGNDFSFLMLEDNTELRDTFNAAIADMKADGTLDSLVETYINGVIAGDEPQVIELPRIDGAKTVRVAVTGSLPPMDYVAPDGTPAGFNTAVLSEIGNRTGLNLELVQVDSVGRAMALATGNVDVVFWTRTSKATEALADMEGEQQNEALTALFGEMTEMEAEAIESYDMVGSREALYAYAVSDMPEGTVATDPYYSDVIVDVILNVTAEGIVEDLKQE
jgi:ABC-type amino acid transport/signal transduction systems, periplasmic component/domain